MRTAIIGAGNSACSSSNFPCEGLETMISEAGIILPFANPRAIEPPMFPAPIILFSYHSAERCLCFHYVSSVSSPIPPKTANLIIQRSVELHTIICSRRSQENPTTQTTDSSPTHKRENHRTNILCSFENFLGFRLQDEAQRFLFFI